jgi:hypothetical protein
MNTGLEVCKCMSINVFIRYLRKCFVMCMLLCRCFWASCGHARQWRPSWCTGSASVTCSNASGPRDGTSPASTRTASTTSSTAAPAYAWNTSCTSIRVSDRFIKVELTVLVPCAIYYWNKDSSSSVGNVDHYVINRLLLTLILFILVRHTSKLIQRVHKVREHFKLFIA